MIFTIEFLKSLTLQKLLVNIYFFIVIQVDEDIAKIGVWDTVDTVTHGQNIQQSIIPDESLIARLDMADYKFSFHEKAREYNPAWMSPECMCNKHYILLILQTDISQLLETQKLQSYVSSYYRILQLVCVYDFILRSRFHTNA